MLGLSLRPGSPALRRLPGVVTLTGTPQVGQTLTASEPSTFSISGVAKSFLAASTTYVPVPGDVGKTVTATGTTSGTTSAATTAVINAASPAVSPTISYGAKVAIYGDSISQQNAQGAPLSGDATQGGANSRATGELTQLLTLDPRINAVNWYDQSKTTAGTNRLTNGSDQGINGQTSTQVLSRLQADLSSLTFDGVIWAAGTNNTAQKADATNYVAFNDAKAAITAVRNAGKFIIVGTIRPNALANESTTRARADIQAINAQIRAYVAGLADPLVVLWDAYAQYDRGDGYIEPLDTYDRLLHPTETGAELGAWGNDPASPSPTSLAFAIRRLVQPGNVYADLMAANANVLTNPTLTGTTGAVAAPITGTTPTAWRWEPQSTVVSTGVASVEANADTGGQSAKLVITPSGTATYERINFRLSAFTQSIANLAGLWARFFVEVETDGTPWLMAPAAILSEIDSGTAKQASQGFLATLSPGTGNFFSGMRPIARRRLIMSEPLLLGSGVTGLQPSVQFAFMPNGASGTATVKVRRAWMATVPNPKTAWGQ